MVDLPRHCGCSAMRAVAPSVDRRAVGSRRSLDFQLVWGRLQHWQIILEARTSPLHSGSNLELGSQACA
eukprot:CAMPEP_0202063304 /NCGR_PEP_ID=MMETSP0963-20130614/46147_1 /ASSEMBLY_ACC=CAM_ASM_000494 /TAXON_ID=4773 /ORGANISM="Schizochytrium aggregatum, Strain ATCC28209" /LENGTH=68 /DNA_ID=CAMNT_0048629689 /DNA_START=97 /DNA_END=303 /DNA_ORIENTATION=+